MTQIMLDQATIDRLRAAGKVAQILDPHGTTVGFFEPADLHVYDEGELPDFDETELDRREQRWQGIPAEEVRRRLEKLR
ncbi:MAG TPA: hypothetical protein VMP01_19200 [Pirellulaceae bacterium]|nr:hypothetical protein [Pirellulaceae bacterium]